MRKSQEIDNPTYYIQALHGEYAKWAFSEDRAEALRGNWRQAGFGGADNCRVDEAIPLDVEIGTGNGFFFAYRALTQPDRLLVGIELKFKPLIQAVRRAIGKDCQNARMVRYHAGSITNLFAPLEIDNIFIHHPDPWTKRRKQKHRLLKTQYLNELYALQRPGSFLEFKTDSVDYFVWAKEQFVGTSYILERYSEDLHRSEWAHENFITYFERIFLRQNLPIYYMRFVKATS